MAFGTSITTKTYAFNGQWKHGKASWMNCISEAKMGISQDLGH